MMRHSYLIKLLVLDINYFHCQQIIEILKTTEKDSKNIFGSYTSQRMKDWNQVLKSYEKDNLFIAEAAQLLSRNINYEIPSARKQMTTLEKLSSEALNKSNVAIKTENILRNEFNIACQQLGIKGDQIKRELKEKLSDLPSMQNEVAKKVPKIQSAASLYENFSGNKHCLPLIKHLIKLGNTTVYEYKYNESPVRVEEPELNINDNDDEQLDVIEAEIDFGDEPEVNLEVGEINWDDEIEVDNNQEIDFDISLEESGIIVEDSGMLAGVAKGDEALTLIDSPHYRDAFLDELFELEAFLKMRLYELTASDKVHVISMSLLDGFTDHDAKSVNAMIASIGEVIAAMTNAIYMQIYQIKHSPKYVDILTNKLRQKLRGIEKMKANQSVLREKSKELKADASELMPNLNKMIEQTKILQKNVSRI